MPASQAGRESRNFRDDRKRQSTITGNLLQQINQQTNLVCECCLSVPSSSRGYIFPGCRWWFAFDASESCRSRSRCNNCVLSWRYLFWKIFFFATNKYGHNYQWQKYRPPPDRIKRHHHNYDGGEVMIVGLETITSSRLAAKERQKATNTLS